MQFGRLAGSAVLAAGVACALGGSARAQEDFPLKPYRLKVGGFSPRSRNTRDGLGQNFLAFGLGYDFKRSFFILPVTFEAYVDYFDHVKHTSDFGRVQGRVLGGGVTARYNLDPEARDYRPYFGLGVGLYRSWVKQDDPLGFSANRRRVNLGGKVSLGTDLSQGLFGEVSYDFVPHPSIFGDDVSLSGYQARIGIRF